MVGRCIVVVDLALDLDLALALDLDLVVVVVVIVGDGCATISGFSAALCDTTYVPRRKEHLNSTLVH